MRKSGILLHISSLASPYGIGTLGKAAFDFIDFLKASGQRVWQVLPTNPTAFGNSPYQSPSVFAGNPLLIDLDLLKENELLDSTDFDGIDFGDNPEKVDFEKVEIAHTKLLKQAFSNFTPSDEFATFCNENAQWLNEYAYFCALSNFFDGAPWQEWDEDAKNYPPDNTYIEKLHDSIEYYKFLQYIFYKQWADVKSYAEENDVEIIGDLPIYAALDSADVWANRGLFLLDEDGYPTAVAGCPPDAFSEDGQHWGNPLYNWDAIREQWYNWWIRRIQQYEKMFDRVRIDHFRGFESFFAIPAETQLPKDGNWIPGPGKAFFDAVKLNCKIKIIAEDLGHLTPEVYELLDYCDFPGMKVLQFAFDPYGDNPYLLHNHTKNSVCYTGTHDNDTCVGWYKTEENKEFIKEYLNVKKDSDVPDAMIRTVLSSPSDLAIIPIQDFLDINIRMNAPSTLNQDNWSFRIKENVLTKEASTKIYNLTKIYKRI